jgi:hypothetical protein
MVAHEVNDMELNREIFDIDDEATEDPSLLNTGPETEMSSHRDKTDPSPTPPVELLNLGHNSNKEKVDLSAEEEMIQVLDCPIEESSGILSTNEAEAARKIEAAEAASTSTNTISVVKSGSNKSRRFDSVRGLLEKVRHKLITTKQSWRRSLSRNRSGAQSQERPQNVEAAEAEEGVDVSNKELLKQKDLLAVPGIPLLASDLASQSQSSPNTPAQLRKEKRHRSFSPVR